MQAWLIEILKGIGKLFLHPIFYYLIFLAYFLGVARVKKERKNFHTRVLNVYFELKQLFPLGILAGLILSIIVMGAGIVVPFAALILIAAFTFLWSLTLNKRLMAPAYTIGAAFFALVAAAQNHWPVPFFTNAFASLDQKVYPSIAGLLALLILTEGFLIIRNGSRGTSPRLVLSKRGQRIGIHEVKRLWMVPVFMLIPGNAVHLPFSWWPVFHLGAEEYNLILIPFAIGFQQRIQGLLPQKAVKMTGERVLLLGIILLALSAAAYWYPFVAIVAVALAVLGRALISFIQRVQDEGRSTYFSKKNHGLVVLGLIPESPADKMGLKVGELITKVNGTPVRDEKTFYEALQINRAYCKLEVLDEKGEVRFAHTALYEGDHYELGILFVQDETANSERVGS